MGFCMLCVGKGAAAASLVMSPASPTELDRITFTVFYDDSGIRFDGFAMAVGERTISIAYRQTGIAVPSPSAAHFTQTIGPLPVGNYIARVSRQRRSHDDERYHPPAPDGSVVAFAVKHSNTNSIDVTELFHSGRSHYFVSEDRQEIDALLASPSAGWVRTGQSFKVPRTPVDGAAEVCRFRGSGATAPDARFLTLDSHECLSLKLLQQLQAADQPRWNFEGIAFAAQAPVHGSCVNAAFSLPVRRFHNGDATRGEGNHRYVVSDAIAATMRAKAWIDEGVVMCALSPDR